jgi:predicted O-methyltransferase YrrM
MLSGALQGNFLTLFSTLLQPNRILEIGTFTGYSALCLAKGLRPQGQLHTIELREAEAVVAQQFFDRSHFASQLFLHQGNAHEIIPTLEHPWDLVFLDADKVSYIDYFNMVFSSLRAKGFILVDNVFFHGQVFGTELRGKNAKAVAAFNEFIKNRTDVEVLMLPLRDGLSLIQKK